jgi:hypothetical protein
MAVQLLEHPALALFNAWNGGHAAVHVNPMCEDIKEHREECKENWDRAKTTESDMEQTPCVCGFRKFLVSLP